ncbi:hypothetical protein ACFLYI_02105 [Chloroflexota bacterium]
MNSKWLTRIVEATVVTLTLAAILQELETPTEERKWHGKIANFIPYDFRLPTIERLKEVYWNPYERRVLAPEVFGIGWTINLYRLLENLGIIKQTDVSEKSFLMPTESIKDTLTLPRATD